MSQPKENNNNIRSLDDAAEGSSSKRPKKSDDRTPAVVMTFSAAHDRFARLQLLGSHTLYHLVSALCKYTPVGYEGSETANDHLWYVTVDDTKYESSDHPHGIVTFDQEALRANQTRLDSLPLYEGCKLHLTYDMGTTSFYTISYMGQRPLTSEENRGMFPRNKVSNAMPPTYVRYVPPTLNGNEPLNLDTTFPDLQRYIFNGNTTVNLFQAGKKKNYGFIQKDSGVLGMLYLPVKADDLANYINYFNDGARVPAAGMYGWHSVVMLPRSKLTNALEKKYCADVEPGFCDALIGADMFRTVGSNDLNAYFPKIAALAGYRRDSRVPKGWVTFTKRGNTCNLVICSGDSVNHKSNAPKGTAYDGMDQHKPVEEPLIQVSGVNVGGLNDLFCVVEGLLMTL